MDGCSSTSTSSPWVKNQGIGRTSDKRKINGSWKIKPQPTAATAAAATPAVSLSVRLSCFHSCHYFGTQTLWIHVFVYDLMSGSGWGRHWKICCKTPRGNLAENVAWQISCGPATSTTRVWNVLFHISRAEQVMWGRDMNQTRSIKSNSAVNPSRKPGMDLCCDLLQHLQGVPRTCSFYIIIVYVLPSILLVLSLKLYFI